MQYSERARFGLHPEDAAPYNVLLGLLGREQFSGRYPYGPPILRDEFANPARGWPATQAAYGSARYANGGYRTTITQLCLRC